MPFLHRSSHGDGIDGLHRRRLHSGEQNHWHFLESSMSTYPEAVIVSIKVRAESERHRLLVSNGDQIRSVHR